MFNVGENQEYEYGDTVSRQGEFLDDDVENNSYLNNSFIPPNGEDITETSTPRYDEKIGSDEKSRSGESGYYSSEVVSRNNTETTLAPGRASNFLTVTPTVIPPEYSRRPSKAIKQYGGRKITINEDGHNKRRTLNSSRKKSHEVLLL